MNAPFAVTLTLKQGRRVTTTHDAAWNGKVAAADVYEPLDRDRCEQNLRHFTNLLNRAVFGKAADRYGKKVRIVPVLEGGNGTRFHYHCAIDCPSHIDPQTFPDMIRDAWSKTDWGYHEVDVQPDADDGWLRYISKRRTKDDLGLSIDWTNVHVS